MGRYAELEERLLAVLRMKPRRSASGVATITVITKPWPCGGDCLFCPNDLRMPKSYLHNEPACERAEQNWFDPYLQVTSRLTALTQMGHATDKIELIVLGGTWSDYPREYQVWFISELFRALNEFDEESAASDIAERRSWYRSAGFPQNAEQFALFAEGAQEEIAEGPSPTTTHFGCCTATASRGVWPVAPRRPRSMSSSCGNAKTRAHVIVWWAL